MKSFICQLPAHDDLKIVGVRGYFTRGEWLRNLELKTQYSRTAPTTFKKQMRPSEVAPSSFLGNNGNMK
jgi:hypothetical protein